MSASTELKVGSFVIASTALVLGGVIALGSGSLFKDTEIIETSTMESVDGLQVGSPVKYRGVPIGQVDAISFADRFYPEDGEADAEFDYASPVVIRMKVRIDTFGPAQSDLFTKDIARGVERGLRARLASAGLTGGLFVELDVLDPTLFPQGKPAFDPAFPFVPSAPSRLDQMLTNIERITSNLSEVYFSSLGSSLRRTIDDIDSVVRRRVDGMLANADAFVGELRASNTRLREILDDPAIARTMDNAKAITDDLRGTVAPNAAGLREALAELPAMMRSARAAADRLDAIVQSPRVEEILGGLGDASKELGPTLREYRDLGGEASDFLSSQEAEIRELISALRQTARNLEAISDRMRSDAPQVLFGKPPAKVPPGTPQP